MDISNHTISDLFAQLGLPSEERDIRDFVVEHGSMPDGARLADAQFWSEAQARFLRQAILEDADWAHVIDELNLMLHR